MHVGTNKTRRRQTAGGLSCGAHSVRTKSNTLSVQKRLTYRGGSAGRLCLGWGWGSASQPQSLECWWEQYQVAGVRMGGGGDHLCRCEWGRQAPSVRHRVVQLRVPAVPTPLGAQQARKVVGMRSRCTVRSTRARRYIPRIPSGTVGNFCISTVSPQRGTMFRQKTVGATVELHAKTL